MRQLLLSLFFLTMACAPKKAEQSNNAVDSMNGDKNVAGLNDELKGDFLLYSGGVHTAPSQNALDAYSFVELVLDTDKRFAIRTRFAGGEVKTDSITFTLQGGQSNKGFGTWLDLGDKIELKFQSGTVDSFFDEKDNKENVTIVDNHTLQLNKAADQIWIWKTLCKK